MELTTLKLENIIEMLNAEEEDAKLGLSIINERVKVDPVGVILAYKFSNCAWLHWAEEAPEAWKFITSIKPYKENTIYNLTFKEIFNHILKTKYPPKEMQLYLDYFAKFLTNQCLNMGYNFIDKVDIQIKLKEDE